MSLDAHPHKFRRHIGKRGHFILHHVANSRKTLSDFCANHAYERDLSSKAPRVARFCPWLHRLLVRRQIYFARADTHRAVHQLADARTVSYCDVSGTFELCGYSQGSPAWYEEVAVGDVLLRCVAVGAIALCPLLCGCVEPWCTHKSGMRIELSFASRHADGCHQGS